MDEARKDFCKPPAPKGLRPSLAQNHHLFVTSKERLSEAEVQLRKDLLDGFPVLRRAFEVKTQIHALYGHKTRAGAEKEFREWSEKIRREKHHHFYPILTTFENWGHEIFNYFDEPYTNGYVEAMNRQLNRINDLATGLSFTTFRAKVLLRYGQFHGPGEFRPYHLGGVKPADRRHYYGEGLPPCDGFELGELVTDLEQGRF